MAGRIDLDSWRGVQLGFTSERFGFGSYLWEEPNRILISMIVSSRRRGNFRALVQAIQAEGKAVAVPTPVGDMVRIVRKNGYVHSQELQEFGLTCDLWTLFIKPTSIKKETT